MRSTESATLIKIILRGLASALSQKAVPSCSSFSLSLTLLHWLAAKLPIGSAVTHRVHLIKYLTTHSHTHRESQQHTLTCCVVSHNKRQLLLTQLESCFDAWHRQTPQATLYIHVYLCVYACLCVCLCTALHSYICIQHFGKQCKTNNSRRHVSDKQSLIWKREQKERSWQRIYYEIRITV